MVVLVDHLADTPVPVEELAARIGLDSAAVPQLLEVGGRAELVKTIPLLDGDVVYSPFFGFKNPDVVGDLVREHGPAQLADAFAALRGEQGMPVTAAQPVLQYAIARSLLLAPAVELPNHTVQSFAALPYTPQPGAATRSEAGAGEGTGDPGVSAMWTASRGCHQPAGRRLGQRDRQALGPPPRDPPAP
ncbi:hypothetical protein GCM10011609_88270 [Lentzea pudingi]|uniref:Uncharacterized protein n=1 Tax=Lentzea pudingi TaxID=1789439 RepID=A0ABQ2IX27_9PSEU|nr:hypothetical protein GCM10011609_88270 [Lentzea pudingi]